MLSQHSNHHEDRWFEFKKLNLQGSGSRIIKKSGFNDYDRSIDHTCDRDSVIVGIISHHHNHAEDRKFDISCGAYQYYKWEDSSLCEWTKQNSLDGTLDAKCSNFGLNFAIAGMKSQHSNHHEDRWFQFFCCPLKRFYPKRPARKLVTSS